MVSTTSRRRAFQGRLRAATESAAAGPTFPNGSDTRAARHCIPPTGNRRSAGRGRMPRNGARAGLQSDPPARHPRAGIWRRTRAAPRLAIHDACRHGTPPGRSQAGLSPAVTQRTQAWRCSGARPRRRTVGRRGPTSSLSRRQPRSPRRTRQRRFQATSGLPQGIPGDLRWSAPSTSRATSVSPATISITLGPTTVAPSAAPAGVTATVSRDGPRAPPPGVPSVDNVGR